MSPRYLLDTNVLSEPMREKPQASVLERLRLHQDEVATAATVWHELVWGMRRLPPSRRRRTIEQYLADVVRASMPILPYGVAAAEWHAAERARLVALGKTPPFADGQIAAIAQTNDLILVTANTVDFRSFAELQVEDWRS